MSAHDIREHSQVRPINMEAEWRHGVHGPHWIVRGSYGEIFAVGLDGVWRGSVEEFCQIFTKAE